MSDENKPVVTESAELIPVDSTTLNREVLKQESTALLAQLAQETNLEKTQDLTYLFNVNHSKKAMLRQETLDDTMDCVVGELHHRVKDKPDEFDTETLLKTANTIQTIMEKNAMQVTSPDSKPLIQLNKTDININQPQEETDPMLKGLSATERKNVGAFFSTLFKTPTEATTVEIVDEEDPNGK